MPQREPSRKRRRQWAPDARALELLGDRWLLVIVRDLGAGPLRLEELRRWLPGLSTGALEARLAKMAEEGLLVRRRTRSLPPRVDLELTERGRSLLPLLGELARWELRTRWSAPRPDEWVDVAACFRLAPFLANADRDRDGVRDGVLALAIDEPGRGDAYAFVRQAGRARLDRGAPDRAAAQLRGGERAWVEALSRGAGTDGLQVRGERPLADAFLALFRSDA